jgi:hypothetical protein
MPDEGGAAHTGGRRMQTFTDPDFAPRDGNVNLIGTVQTARVREILTGTLGSEARRSETA